MSAFFGRSSAVSCYPGRRRRRSRRIVISAGNVGVPCKMHIISRDVSVYVRVYVFLLLLLLLFFYSPHIREEKTRSSTLFHVVGGYARTLTDKPRTPSQSVVL
jgi:hypothetical protein